MENSILPVINPLLRRPVVERATGYSRSTIYREIKKGLFTKPVEIGGTRVAWPASEIEALNKARISGKTDEEIKTLVIKLEAARCEDNKKLADSFNSPQEENGGQRDE
jgi:prophage regulatory protein